MQNYADVLESYKIDTEDQFEPAKPALNFFNRENWVTLQFYGLTKAEAMPHLGKLIKSSKTISAKIEKEFCRICNLLNQDPPYSGIPANSIKKYSDIKELSLSHVEVFKDKYNSNTELVFVLKGDYAIDDEHGWSIGITESGKWDGTIRDFSGDYGDYLTNAEENSYQKSQKSKTVKVF